MPLPPYKHIETAVCYSKNIYTYINENKYQYIGYNKYSNGEFVIQYEYDGAYVIKHNSKVIYTKEPNYSSSSNIDDYNNIIIFMRDYKFEKLLE